MLYVHTNRAAEDMCNCTTLGNKEHSRETSQGISEGSFLGVAVHHFGASESVQFSAQLGELINRGNITYTRGR